MSFDYTDADRHNFLALEGTLDLTITLSGFSATLTGTFGFEKTTLTVNGAAISEIKVFVTGATTSLSVGAANTGVKVFASGINGAFLLNSDGVAGQLAVGLITLTHPDGSVLSGLSTANISNFLLELNTTGNNVSATIGGVTFDYSGADRHNFLAIAGTLDLTINVGAVSATIQGTFGFERSSVTVNSTLTQVVKVSVSEANTSLTIGTAPGGVQVAFKHINGALFMNDSGRAGKLAIGEISLTQADGVTPLGGEVEVASRPGAGTTLTIRVPWEVSHAAAPADC